jgi:hypothetical protein
MKRTKSLTRRSKVFVVVVIEFEMESFPVPVQHLRLQQAQVFGTFFGNEPSPTKKKGAPH